MNLYEAAKEAISQGKCITLPWGKGSWKIRPTNEKGNCILISADGRQSKTGWQPTADDLINEEWILAD